jgi:hypothetical protein
VLLLHAFDDRMSCHFTPSSPLPANAKKHKQTFTFVRLSRGSKEYQMPLFSLCSFFKDELQGNLFDAFCGLRSKAYTYKVKKRNEEGTQTKTRCKGIAKSYRERITFDSYLACIKKAARIKSQMRSIRAKNNVLRIQHMKKTAVSSFDDKRFYTVCYITVL